MMKLRMSLVAFVGCLALGGVAHAATYSVSPSGNDQNSGAMGSPWQTLQHAANSVAPGDTVIVEPGNYTGFQLDTSGSANAPIVFQAQPGVVIDQENPVTSDGINIEGASYVVVEGFHVVGMGRAGIRAVLCDQVIIRNNVSEQNFSWGILTGFCDNLLIEGNETFGSIDEHGIYVGNSGDSPVIRRNRIHDNNANGIHINGDASQGGDGVVSNAFIEGNIIYNNGTAGGSAINCDGVQDSRIVNNLIFDTHASGISFYQIDGGSSSKNNIVANNTILVASNGRWCMNIQNGSTGNQLYNNILYNLHSFRGSIDISQDSLPGFVSNNNVVMDRLTTDGGNNVLALTDWQTATGQDMNSLVSTPAELFAGMNDYHLSSTSPAIDKGTMTEAPAQDIEGVKRPFGSAIDIGAYEYCVGDCAGTGGAGGAGGNPSSGPGGAGPGGSSGTAGSAANQDTGETSGCGCRLVAEHNRLHGVWVAGLVLGFLLRRRRCR